MPTKIDPYQSPGMKIITLLFRFLYTDEPQGLIELARHLNCSKQTVMRHMDYLQRALDVEFEITFQGRRKYYRIKHRKHSRHGSVVTCNELAILEMCSSFTQHLIGKKLFNEAVTALNKVWVSLPEGERISTTHFGDLIPGTIDYTPYYGIIQTLIQGMERSDICKITYRSITDDVSKNFFIKPYKLFSHKDTLYLHAGWAKYPNRKYVQPEFDPLLPVHRIEALELTDRKFVIPENYNFEKAFNESFGVIKDDTFHVEVEFSGWSARFIQERIWSPDQRITKRKDGSIRIHFSASSKSEICSWVLSFMSEAKVIKPKWLKTLIAQEIMTIQENYR